MKSKRKIKTNDSIKHDIGRVKRTRGHDALALAELGEGLEERLLLDGRHEGHEGQQAAGRSGFDIQLI